MRLQRLVPFRPVLAVPALAFALAVPAHAAGNDPGSNTIQAPAKPVLVVENANLDLGKVQEGVEAVAVFKLKNTGNAELKILSAKPG